MTACGTPNDIHTFMLFSRTTGLSYLSLTEHPHLLGLVFFRHSTKTCRLGQLDTLNRQFVNISVYNCSSLCVRPLIYKVV